MGVHKNIKVEIVMLILIMTSIILVTVDLGTELSMSQRRIIYTTDFVICAILAVEFIYRLKLSSNRIKFLKQHWYEIFALMPAYLFSLLELQAVSIPARSLRFIRVFRVIRVLRAGILYARIFKFLNMIWTVIVESKIPYLLTLAFSTILASSAAVYSFEHSTPNSPVKSIFDALWWTLTTLTTVGYGDIVPVTFEGKIIGIILMIVGITIWTATISLLTVTLVERRYEKAKSLNDELINLIKKYSNKIDELTLEERRTLAKLTELISKED